MAGWQLKGKIVLACNCDFGCPCNFNGYPSYGKCEGGWNWLIEKGSFGDLSLDGLGISLVVNWPKAIHEGDGEGVAFVDERADDSQREALEKLLSGSEGGPWAILSNTISTLHGPTPASFEFSIDGISSRVRVGDAIELELEPVKNPVSGAEVHPQAVLPEGFVFKQGELARSKSFWVRDGISLEHTGKYAAFAPFEYAGP